MGARVRVLQVLYHFVTGGIENYLIQILQHLPQDRFEVDIVVHADLDPAYQAKAESLGARVFRLPGPTQFWKFGRSYRKFFSERPKYDVVHCHTFFAGLALREAARAGVPNRIAHSHGDKVTYWDGPWLKCVVVKATNWLYLRHAHVQVGCSKAAAEGLFGSNALSDPRTRILFYGIDMNSFPRPEAAESLRRELGLENAWVIGHTGRFAEQKNHAFLIDIFSETAARDPQARLLLIGDGPLRPGIESKVEKLGLKNKVVFAGMRRDVPNFLAAMDVFLMPSLHEGLPIAGIEALTAGLPGLYGSNIAEELSYIPSLVRRCSLAQPASEWADALLSMKAAGQPLPRSEAHRLMAASPFNIVRAGELVRELYYSKPPQNS